MIKLVIDTTTIGYLKHVYHTLSELLLQWEWTGSGIEVNPKCTGRGLKFIGNVKKYARSKQNSFLQ